MAAHYRALDPMAVVARRGHDVVWPAPDGTADPQWLVGCDVVHVYRRADDQTRRVLTELAREGTAITFDNDDDLRTIPEESPDYEQFGGETAQRLWADSVKTARMAGVFTTTNEILAERYRSAGVERIEVIPNLVRSGVDRSRVPHDGIVIGWIAGIDHAVDVARIPIVDALRRLLAKHDHVRVECIGVDAGLSERYRYDPLVALPELPPRIGGFDIGIAPLPDIPANDARTDIEIKEYRASGVPWLASPARPYSGLGEQQGGRLVPDDGWFEALDELVTDERERERLSSNAAAWARTETIDAVAARWEGVFAEAAGIRASRFARRFRPSPGVSARVRPPGAPGTGRGRRG